MLRAALMFGAIIMLLGAFVASAKPPNSPPARPSPLASILPPRTLFMDGQMTRLTVCQFPEDIAPIGICIFTGQNGCLYAFKQDNAEAKWDPVAKQCPEPKTKGTLL